MLIDKSLSFVAFQRYLAQLVSSISQRARVPGRTCIHISLRQFFVQRRNYYVVTIARANQVEFPECFNSDRPQLAPFLATLLSFVQPFGTNGEQAWPVSELRTSIMNFFSLFSCDSDETITVYLQIDCWEESCAIKSSITAHLSMKTMRVLGAKSLSCFDKFSTHKFLK